MRLRTRQVRIEMIVPDDMDASHILERLQELAVEWCEEHDIDEDDDEYEGMNVPSISTEDVEGGVSVQEALWEDNHQRKSA